MMEASASAAERAYRALRDDILDGTHQPGTMLSETLIARALGISRTPVRGALTRLQQEGWIVIYPQRGALVQGLSERSRAELADAMFVLETTAVDRAPAELRQRLADQLDESIAAQRVAFDSGDVRSFIEITLQFHRGFVEAGGNRMLLELHDRLNDRYRFVLFDAGELLLARCATIIAEHEQLTQSLRVGDASEFARVLREHISEVLPSTNDVFGRLVAQGRITLPPSAPAPWESQDDATGSPSDVDALLEEVRGER